MICTSIKGWKNDAGEKFHAAMTEKVKGYEGWDHAEVEREVFNRCEQQHTDGESMDYEISQFQTFSGHTELLRFSDDEFEMEQYEVDE